MPQPTASDVHVNTPLTMISIAFMQEADGFVADKVFPNIPVQQQSNRYYVYSRADWNRSEAQERAPGTESAGSGWSLDNTPTYFASVKAIHKDVDDQIRANQDAVIDMDRDATMYVSHQMMLKRDIDWATSNFTTSIWTGSTTGGDITPGVLWSTSTSTPVEDIREQYYSMLEKTGKKANTLVLGARVWEALQDHAEFLDRIKFTQTGIVGTELLAAVFGIDRVLVASAIQNTANEGASESSAFILGKNALLCYSAPRPSILEASAGYTFSWTGMLGAGAMGQRIKRFRLPHLSSDRVEGELAYDQKVVAPELGVFFSSVVA